MKYMMIVMENPNSGSGRRYERGEPPDEKLMQAISAHAEKMRKAGVLLDTGGLLPSATGARLKVAAGRLAIIDGPFAETKEVIGGFGILEAGSKAEAIKLGREFMQIHVDVLGPSYEGVLEIRQMFDGHDCCDPTATASRVVRPESVT